MLIASAPGLKLMFFIWSTIPYKKKCFFRVAGVTAGEFALAHFLVSLVVNLLQVVVTLVFMILVFQVKKNTIDAF